MEPDPNKDWDDFNWRSFREHTYNCRKERRFAFHHEKGKGKKGNVNTVQINSRKRKTYLKGAVNLERRNIKKIIDNNLSSNILFRENSLKYEKRRSLKNEKKKSLKNEKNRKSKKRVAEMSVS